MKESNADELDELAAAYATLEQADITFQDHPTLYEAVIENVDYLDELTVAFAALKQAGINVQDQLMLYDAVIENIDYAANLPAAFAALQQVGITFQDHPLLYEEVIENAVYADNLSAAYVTLEQANIMFKDQPTLYYPVIQKARWADKLVAAFVALKQASISPQEYGVLYQTVIHNAGDADKLAFAFVALQTAGISVQEHMALYEVVIEMASFADNLALAFAALEKVGIKAQNNLERYKVVIQMTDYADNLPIAFDVLENAGIMFHDHATLYDVVIRNARYADKLAVAFVTLKQADLSVAEPSVLYELVIKYADYADKLAVAFVALKHAGISVQDHWMIYRALIHNAVYADKLAVAFSVLTQTFINVLDHLALYQIVTQDAWYAEKLAIAFSALKQAGIDSPQLDFRPGDAENLSAWSISEQGYSILYEVVVQNVVYADKLAAAFVALKQSDINVQDHWAIYQAVILNANFADSLAVAFAALEQVGIHAQDELETYKFVIKRASSADKVTVAFAALKQAGINAPDHLALYHEVIEMANFATKLPSAFSVLEQVGLTFQDYSVLYEVIIQHADCADKLAAAFVTLENIGITVQDYWELYDEVIQNARHADKLPTAFTQLKKVGITIQEHFELYTGVIQRTNFIEKLIIAFITLRKTCLNTQEYLVFYQLVIEHADFADKLAVVLVELMHAGISVQNHPQLDQLVPAFIALKQACISVKDHSVLYQAVIQNADESDNLTAALEALESAHISAEDHLMFYSLVIQKINLAGKVPAAFAVLKQIGKIAPDHLELYLAVIQNEYSEANLVAVVATLKQFGINIRKDPSVDKLITAFALLEQANISAQDHPTLYAAVIERARCADKLAVIFVALKKIGVTTQREHLELYYFVAQQEITNLELILDNICQFLDKISLLELTLNVPEDFAIINNALKTVAISLDVLTWLQEHKCQKDQHRYLYNACFLGKSPLVRSPYYWSKIKHQFQEYFKKNPLRLLDDDAYEAQCLEVQQLMEKVLRADSDITEGPLNKADASLAIEAILRRIAVAESMDNIQMAYHDAVGYLLKFEAEPDIYLSELLKLANFNHIELSEEHVNLLGDKIQAIAGAFNQELPSIATTLSVQDRLPEAARYALGVYVANSAYKNINRLFRGVALTSELEYSWVRPVDSSHSFMVNFLAGCLVNWSAAELPRRLLYSNERQLLEKVIVDTEMSRSEVIEQIKANELNYIHRLQSKLATGIISQSEYDQAAPLFSKLNTLFPSYGFVDRGEILKDSEHDHDEFCVKRRRLANVVFTPSVMSLSIFNYGSKYFHKPGTVRTKIETDNSNRPVINKVEGEILVAHGTSYHYTQNSNGGFFAREINSPGILPKGDEWSSIAIAEAYRNYLSQPYQQSIHQITIDSTTIQRPNHGLAHEYRVMIYIDIVIDYFAHHAKSEAFKRFCQNISPGERKWLRVAAAYSITGRDNELSAPENLTRYEEARNASRVHMEAFLAKYPPAAEDHARRESMLDIVRWMGNPAYEQEYLDKPAINQHPDPIERDYRNFIHRILSLAHKLDLPRCHGPASFHAAMTIAREYVTQSDEQQADYIRMIQYAVDLIDVHGDYLCTSLAPSGELIPCTKDYRAPFHKVSSNLRQLREITETISYPKLTEQYQFHTDESLESMMSVARNSVRYDF